MELLLGVEGINLEEVDKAMRTPLHIACIKGSLNCGWLPITFADVTSETACGT